MFNNLIERIYFNTKDVYSLLNVYPVSAYLVIYLNGEHSKGRKILSVKSGDKNEESYLVNKGDDYYPINAYQVILSHDTTFKV